MNKLLLLALTCCISAAAHAGTNPFTSKKAISGEAPRNIFSTHIGSVQAKEQGSATFRVPPPIPSFSSVYSSASAEHKKENPGSGTVESASAEQLDCSLSAMPPVPQQRSSGGMLRITFSKKEASCIKGLESENRWLKIGFFDGRTLTVHIRKNTGDGYRYGTLVLASISNSQQIQITQKSEKEGAEEQ